MMKAVIVDDEKDSREILANYIAKYCPDVTVCGYGLKNISRTLYS
jgi:two-component system, LytTR family, response regulator